MTTPHACGGPSLVQAQHERRQLQQQHHHHHHHHHDEHHDHYHHHHQHLDTRSQPPPSRPELDILDRSRQVVLESRQDDDSLAEIVKIIQYVDQTGAPLSVATVLDHTSSRAGYDPTSTPPDVAQSSTTSAPGPFSVTSAPLTTATASVSASTSNSTAGHSASVFTNSSIPHSLGVNFTHSTTSAIRSHTSSSLWSTEDSSSSSSTSRTSSTWGSVTTSVANSTTTRSASRAGPSGSSSSSSSLGLGGIEGGGIRSTEKSTAPGPARTSSAGAGADAGASASAGHTGAGLTPAQQKSVIGGVVGGVAGVALVALLLLFLLKLRKKDRHGMCLVGDSTEVLALPRCLFCGIGGKGGGDEGGGSAMAERRDGPFAFALGSARTSLTGFRRTPDAQRPAPPATNAPGEERGFYRISGKKLTSVLESGGDGYTEPANAAATAQATTEAQADAMEPDDAEVQGLRESMFGSDSVYDDVQAFDGGGGVATRPLQLGLPMRPQSGVIIMRTGPARTPIEEVVPSAPPPSPAPPWQNPLSQNPPSPLLPLSAMGGGGGGRASFTAAAP